MLDLDKKYRDRITKELDLKEMLKMTREMFDLPFNDNIRYEEGDDINNRTEDHIPNDPVNQALQKLYAESPKLIQKPFEFTGKGNMEKYAINRFRCYYLAHKILISKQEHYIKGGDDSEEEALRLMHNEYDGLSYFWHNPSKRRKNMWWIPSAIQKYMENHPNEDIPYTVYSVADIYNDSPRFYKPIEFPTLPEKMQYSIFEEEKFGRINTPEGQWTYLCKNIPYSDYSRMINIDARTLSYDRGLGTYLGHSGDNYAKMSHLCYSIAKNGLPLPVAAQLNGDGTLTLYASNKKQMMAQYLKCPEIPMLIIQGPIQVNPNLIGHAAMPGKARANRLFNPYFMVI